MRIKIRITLVSDLVIFFDFINFVLNDRLSFNIASIFISRHFMPYCHILYISPSILARFIFPKIFYFIFKLGYQHSSGIGINTWVTVLYLPSEIDSRFIYSSSFWFVAIVLYCSPVVSHVLLAVLIISLPFLSLPHQTPPNSPRIRAPRRFRLVSTFFRTQTTHHRFNGIRRNNEIKDGIQVSVINQIITLTWSTNWIIDNVGFSTVSSRKQPLAYKRNKTKKT